MATIHVDPGICGLPSVIRAESDDGQICRVTVESKCEAISALVAELGEVDGYAAAFSNFPDNPVYLAASRHYRHAACPVPSAVIKAIEIACGLALPKDVSFRVE